MDKNKGVINMVAGKGKTIRLNERDIRNMEILRSAVANTEKESGIYVKDKTDSELIRIALEKSVGDLTVR